MTENDTNRDQTAGTTETGTEPDSGTDAAVTTALRSPASASPGDAERLAALHARLERAAADEGLDEIAYREIDSPYGSLLLAATAAGLVRVAFALEDHDRVLATLAEKIGPRILRSPARTDAVARQLDEYFAGRRQRFELPLDLRLTAGFRRSVVEHLPHIPFGRTESYAEVATATGSPKAVRAVGTACATNPLPIVVPCHRVVRTDGTIGQYLGGTDAKLALLEFEGARPRA
ncbi:methylated-DNA--[protein]-cysteine S-methyltransferase [Schumannella luteola]|uniref:Methylated-DNA--protein-cysteine methyltransferase n=1 Tax=Schumannella luteola TaxID=472059 RepID=A0A852Y8I2_9MICO|nr:methylated-DNA--[protein]-cysteine S-methyltransferase [Schumannella luteola]NYG99266.1 methylated-DNA-[protein]-cysteine S-methyltransferase [Schumannella luteola]TPW93564.1 methylated-DNA--[protein]-cysteine S-methyltransferase [Schumannella luteola]